jgi:probable Rubsico expression protein CbbX
LPGPTLAEEREATDIDEVFTSLNDQFVGLLPVKRKVDEIASLLLVDRVRQRFGLQAPRPNLHMCLTGDPGTGKTTVALRMADLLYRLGYLEKGHLVHAMRDDLVGEFIGQTAPKTKRILERAMGGVLFIDEAYYLYCSGDSKDYGQECIDILLQVMEDDRDKLVVILAGYKDRMDVFFESNPGMSSRIAHHLGFAPDKLNELGGHRAGHARLLVLLPCRRGGGGLPRVPDPAHGATAIRQRPQRPQRTGAGPAQARAPPGRRTRAEPEQGRPHAPGGRGPARCSLSRSS